MIESSARTLPAERGDAGARPRGRTNLKGQQVRPPGMIARMPTRTLVLLPGMDGGDKLFGPLRAAAPAGIDTIAIGYPPGPHNDYGDLLPAVRAQLPADRPFFLLGWSFSGPLVLLAAAERPPGLRGVILAASFVKTPVP